jgi:hypothetical protein
MHGPCLDVNFKRIAKLWGFSKTRPQPTLIKVVCLSSRRVRETGKSMRPLRLQTSITAFPQPSRRRGAQILPRIGPGVLRRRQERQFSRLRRSILTPKSLHSFSLHFHSLKPRFRNGLSEVADFLTPVFTAIDAVVVYFQSKLIFPSWTSRGRARSADSFC